MRHESPGDVCPPRGEGGLEGSARPQMLPQHCRKALTSDLTAPLPYAIRPTAQLFNTLLESTAAPGAALMRTLSIRASPWFVNFGAFFLLAVLSGLAAYSAIDLILRTVGFGFPSLRGSLDLVRAPAGGFAASVAFILGMLEIPEMLLRWFPPVQFAGRLRDPGAAGRSRLAWVGSALLLPLALEIGATLLVKAPTPPP